MCYTGHALTFREIAEYFDISQELARRDELVAMSKLKEALSVNPQFFDYMSDIFVEDESGRRPFTLNLWK